MTSNAALQTTLYSKLGGEGTVKALVGEFYGRIVSDAVLAPVFAGVDMARLKRHQALFISQALGGPRQYDGRSMAEAHRGLHITDAQFNRVAGHLDASMAELGVGPGDRATVMDLVGSLRGDVVSAAPALQAQPAPRPVAAPAAPGSLYDKLGGEGTVKALVNEFYGRIVSDAVLAPAFAGVDMGHLKRHQALFISQALGGPKQYDGRSMAEAHRGLNITDAQFNRVAGHLDASMAELGVGPGDRATVMDLVGSLRGDVVSAAPAAQPAPRPVAAPAAPGSLYDKLGGEGTIKVVVEEFYRRILEDERLVPVFEGADMGRLKRHQALFISQALGGPKQYDGRSMTEAHWKLGITDAQFGAVASHLVGTLRHFQVAQADIDTVVGAIAPLQSQVVTSPFRRWLQAG